MGKGAHHKGIRGRMNDGVHGFLKARGQTRRQKRPSSFLLQMEKRASSLNRVRL